MEKKISIDEINSFLANFKKKRGKKTTTTATNSNKEIPPQQKQIDNTKHEEKTNNIKLNNDVFGNDKNDKISNDIFGGDNNDNLNNDIFGTDQKDKIDDTMPWDKKDSENNQTEDIFNDKNIKNDTVVNNNVNINTFEQKEKEIPIEFEENNNLKTDNNKYNDFNSGMVLNNPLLNEQNETNNNLNNENYQDNNNLDEIFDMTHKEDKNVFDTNDNNDNVEDIFSQNKETSKIKTSPFNNISKPKNLNIHRPQPKPPKINNNKFNSPFTLQNPKEKEHNIKQDDPNKIFNNDTNKDNNDNDLFNNNIEYNQDNNNIFEDKNKEDTQINNMNMNNYDIQQTSNNEIEKLDEEQITQNFIDSSKNLNNLNINNFTHLKNQIKNEPNLNINENANTVFNNIVNDDKSKLIQNKNDHNYFSNNNFDNNSHLKFNSGLNNEHTTDSESYNFSSIDQDYVILSLNNGENILINNIFSILSSYSENQLYEQYFPISYNKESNFNKLINFIQIIINNGNDLNEPISHITGYLLKYILENQININKLNILKNGEIRNKIIETLYNSLRNENKGIISLNNLFNTNILFDSLNTNNSVTGFNIMDDNLNHPLDYMINLFHEKILNKNNILYIYLLLLNMKENDNNVNHSIGFEEYDLIFENFDCTLYLLLKYFNDDIKIKNICNILLNSYSPKLNFCHFIILKCLSDDYEINDEKYFGKIVISFLQFVTIEKLLIADIYNFILFTVSSQVKNVVAKSSILIKYKYTLLKQNYKKDQNLLLLGQKIYENIKQFGLISKNNYFRNYIKDSFYNNNNKNLSEINRNNYNNNIQENNTINNINLNYRNNKSKENYIKKEKDNENNGGGSSNEGGIFSTLKNALFGSNESNNDNNKGFVEQDKKVAQVDQEHPEGVPEIEYDPVLKRYKLYGKIYDDQEEVIQKKRLEKPMVPPPKSEKYRNSKKDEPSPSFDEGQNTPNDETNKQMNYNNPFSTSNKINNPFSSTQTKNPPKIPQNNPKKRMFNLANRYAVGYKK